MIKPHPFRFGVINEQMRSSDVWVGQARKVEDHGYATFLMRDHFVPDFFGHQFAPVAALGFLERDQDPPHRESGVRQ